MERTAILIAPCILSPGFQAKRKPGSHWGYPFLTLIMRYGIDIIPLPCAESTFGGFETGLHRAPHGIRFYEGLDGYLTHCDVLSLQTAEQVEQLQLGGYNFLCVLGVENSPSCAVNHIYSNTGTLTRRGVFFQSLEHEFTKRNLNIPMIGVLRRNSPAAYTRLEALLSAWQRAQKDDD